jgi:hypothetical protein
MRRDAQAAAGKRAIQGVVMGGTGFAWLLALLALAALAIYDYNRLVFICLGVVGVWMLVTVASASTPLLLAACVAVAAGKALL